MHADFFIFYFLVDVSIIQRTLTSTLSYALPVGKTLIAVIVFVVVVVVVVVAGILYLCDALNDTLTAYRIPVNSLKISCAFYLLSGPTGIVKRVVLKEIADITERYKEATLHI